MINGILKLIPIKTNSIEDFIEEMKKHECKNVNVIPDTTSAYDLFVTQTTDWVDYTAKTQSGRTIKLRQKPHFYVDSPYALTAPLHMSDQARQYQEQTQSNITLMQKQIPGIQVKYDTSKLEQKLRPVSINASIAQ
jgi:hypothetical protein